MSVSGSLRLMEEPGIGSLLSMPSRFPFLLLYLASFWPPLVSCQLADLLSWLGTNMYIRDGVALCFVFDF